MKSKILKLNPLGQYSERSEGGAHKTITHESGHKSRVAESYKSSYQSAPKAPAVVGRCCDAAGSSRDSLQFEQIIIFSMFGAFIVRILNFFMVSTKPFYFSLRCYFVVLKISTYPDYYVLRTTWVSVFSF